VDQPRGGVELHFVDDFDGNHFAGEHVFGELDDRVVTLAESLAQVVHPGNHLSSTKVYVIRSLVDAEIFTWKGFSQMSTLFEQADQFMKN
jgi:hypothetical protein